MDQNGVILTGFQMNPIIIINMKTALLQTGTNQVKEDGMMSTVIDCITQFVNFPQDLKIQVKSRLKTAIFLNIFNLEG